MTKQIRKKDALDHLAEGDPKGVIALMLWKERHRNPDMAVQITQRDIDGFKACTGYLKVEPDVDILRPEGRPAQEGIPQMGTRREVPARAAEPPRPFVVVRLVEKGTENMIRPVEDNEEDNDKRIAAEKLVEIRAQAPGLAARLDGYARTGDFVASDLRDAAQWLRTLVAVS